MTSVRSPRRLLSGSNILLIIMIFGCLMSCSPSTTSSGRTTVIKPNNGTPEKNNKDDIVKIDTVQWSFVDEIEYPPITSSTEVEEVASFGMEREKKEVYSIALLLPLKLEQTIPSLDKNNEKFAQFYAGIKMAGEYASQPKVEVNVLHTNRDKDRTDQMIAQLDLMRPDLIIAPYDSEIIARTAQYAKNNRITIISPWKSSSRITGENVFFLQMRPSIEQYYAKILDHAKYSFEKDEIRIIQRANGQDKSKTALLQSINEKTEDIPIVEPIQVLDVSIDSLMDAESLVFDELLTEGVKAFILPHFAISDESFVYSTLRKMYAEKLGRQFSIYAMPLILNSERVDIFILKNLDIRVAEFRFPDPKNVEVENFKSAFLTRYGWLPTEDAYYGFDLMTFVLNGLKKYGPYFHYYMAGEEMDLMQMKVKVQPFYKETNASRPDYMINNHLYIIQFDQDHFEISDIR